MTDARLRRIVLVSVLAIGSTTWWYLFWSGHPDHFDVRQTMAMRAYLAAHQPDQNESTRVLFPWIYVAISSLSGPKYGLVVSQLIAAAVFFSGCLMLHLRQRPSSTEADIVATMALLAFYSLSAYQAGNRWGELLAPGLLAWALGTTSIAVTLGAVLLASFQRIEAAFLAVVVGTVDRFRRHLAFPAAAQALGSGLIVVVVALYLASAVPFDPQAPNLMPVTLDLIRVQAVAALKPGTWIWWGAYLLPALLFGASRPGHWTAGFLVGIGLNIAFMLSFGAWSEVRLLLPTIIFLLCGKRASDTASVA